LYTAYFIAYRIRKADKKAFTTLVHKIGIISIALGLAMSLLAFLSIGGFQKNIEGNLTSFQGQLQIYQYALNRSHEELPISTNKIQGIEQAFASTIKSIQPYAHQTVLLQAGEALEGVVLRGVDVQVACTRLSQYLIVGHFINPTQQGYSPEMVLSSKSAARLNLHLGDEVIACIVQQPLRYRKLKLVGIYTTYLEEIDEKLGFCDLKLIQQLNAWPHSLVGGYEVYLQDPRISREVASQILDWLDYDLTIQSTEEAYAAIFDWLAIMRKDIFIFLSLILLVASSNIVSIILIQLMERTKMIGLLQALGASKRLIQQIMLWNNLRLVFKGIFWGNVLGLGLSALQSYGKFIRLDPTYYYINYLPIAWNAWVILRLNLFFFVLISLVLCLSIIVITRLRPSQAMRFQ